MRPDALLVVLDTLGKIHKWIQLKALAASGTRTVIFIREFLLPGMNKLLDIWCLQTGKGKAVWESLDLRQVLHLPKKSLFV